MNNLLSTLLTGVAAFTIFAYAACLGMALLPDLKKRFLDALHHRRMTQLRVTLDLEERRHQQADGRDGKDA